MEDVLYCNNKTCHSPLSSEAWITSCFHVFCNEHFPSAPESIRKCPCCSSDLRERSDVFKKNLKPSEDFKSMVLAGFSPSKIIETGFKALKFLNVQSYHEKMFLQLYIKRQHHSLTEAEVQRNKIETSYQATMEKLKILIQQRKKLVMDLDTCIKKNQFLEEKVQDKNRLLHKILAKPELYRQLSHRSGWVEQSKNKQRKGMGNTSIDQMFCSQQLPPSYANGMNVPFRSTPNQRPNSSSYNDKISLSQNF